MAVEAPVCYYPSLFTPPHSLMTIPQATFRANTPLHLPETSSHPQSSKKSIQPVAEAQGIWPTMILIDQRSRAKARTSNPLRCGRNRCPTTPDEVCELLIKGGGKGIEHFLTLIRMNYRRRSKCVYSFPRRRRASPTGTGGRVNARAHSG